MVVIVVAAAGAGAAVELGTPLETAQDALSPTDRA